MTCRNYSIDLIFHNQYISNTRQSLCYNITLAMGKVAIVTGGMKLAEDSKYELTDSPMVIVHRLNFIPNIKVIGNESGREYICDIDYSVENQITISWENLPELCSIYLN